MKTLKKESERSKKKKFRDKRRKGKSAEADKELWPFIRPTETMRGRETQKKYLKTAFSRYRNHQHQLGLLARFLSCPASANFFAFKPPQGKFRSVALLRRQLREANVINLFHVIDLYRREIRFSALLFWDFRARRAKSNFLTVNIRWHGSVDRWRRQRKSVRIHSST